MAVIEEPHQQKAGGDGSGGSGGGGSAGDGHIGERGSGNTRGGGGTGGVGAVGGADVRRLIAERIREHRRYPTLARRRGLQGTVWLSLAIAPDGSVDARVSRGADPLLDEAAREAALAAAPLPFVDGTVEVPLTFRLLDE